MKDRIILHCDCNSFFASVECLREPRLWQVPMAVCGSADDRRGIVLAKNELAKRYGIVTAETLGSAKRKCPELVVVPPRHGAYAEVSRAVNEIYLRYTDLCEPFSIDESWLDVTGSEALFGDGLTIANAIREAVKAEIGITISVGVSFNKTFAKMGSDYKKPDAVTLISRENFRELLYPMPIENMLFVGQKTAETLRASHILTIGDLAATGRLFLKERLGKLGEQLHDAANGIDPSPVLSPSTMADEKSMGNGMTFRRDIATEEEIRLSVRILCEELGERLRRKGKRASTVTLTVKDPALRSVSRQESLKYASDIGREISEAALSLLPRCHRDGAPIRMLTVTVSRFDKTEDGEQIGFFDAPEDERREKLGRLESAVDGIRRRFGDASIYSGAVMENDLGIDLPEKREDPKHED